MTLPTTHTHLHLVSVCMHYVLGIASVCLCWSRQSWACPTDNHEEEETEELGQQRQQQRGHHRQQETQPRHQLQPLQSGTCKHQLHWVCLFFFYCSVSLFLSLMHVCRVTSRCHKFLMVLQLLSLIYLHKWKKKLQEERVGKETQTCVVRQRTPLPRLPPRDAYENVSPQKTKRKYIRYQKGWHIKNHQSSDDTGTVNKSAALPLIVTNCWNHRFHFPPTFLRVNLTFTICMFKKTPLTPLLNQVAVAWRFKKRKKKGLSLYGLNGKMWAWKVAHGPFSLSHHTLKCPWARQWTHNSSEEWWQAGLKY